MSNNKYRHKPFIYPAICLLVLLYMFTDAGISYARQIQIVPILPQLPSTQAKLSDMPIEDHSENKEISDLSEFEEPYESEELLESLEPSGEKTEILSEEKTEILSEFERFISGDFPETVSTDIRQFGYDLFSGPSLTMAPITSVPVGPGYVLGPGDEVRITVWGKIEGSWNVVVDRDGNISLPKIGIIGVTGLTFSEFKILLKKEFSKYYTNFEMNVSMGALKTIRVYIVGNALRPGVLTISSLSTLINALFEAGGPRKTGTMRDIQLKRNGQTIRRLDMYDFLLKGDKSKDIRLMPEDVIFIPSVGPLAGIAGQVTIPAIYELTEETKITDLIAMAGGITATGYLQKIQVERIYNNEARILVDTSLKKLGEGEDFFLQDRDVIKVFPISNAITNAVSLKGNVTRPGEYQWVKDMKVSDIIKEPSRDLLPETHYTHALIDRYIHPDYHKEIISFDLGKALFEKDEKENKALMPYDVLTIYSKWEFREKPIVKIAGAVNKPGDYELKPNMTLSDLINLAGGLKRYAFKKHAELTRVNITQEGPDTKKISIDLEYLSERSSKNNISLKEDDYLFVRTVPEWRLYQTAAIDGEVKFPGTYTIERGDTLSSLIERAGGYSDRAYLRGTVFIRESVREIQQKSIDEMVERLERQLLAEGSVQISTALSNDEIQAKKMELDQQQKFISSLKELMATGRMSIRLAHLRLLKNSEYDIELEEGDNLYIPVKNSVINVMGAVMSRGSFIYSEHLDYKNYVETAGGYTKYADEDNVYVLKVDGTAMKLSKGFFNWDLSKSRWKVAAFNEGIKTIEPGDSIIVPEKLDRIAWLREIKDITQILFQVATTAGVVILLF